MALVPGQVNNQNQTLPSGWGGSSSTIQYPDMPQGWGGSSQAIQPKKEPQIAVSASPAESEFAQQSLALTNAITGTGMQPVKPAQTSGVTGTEKPVSYEDEFTRALDLQMTQGDELTRSIIAGIQARNQDLRNQVQSQSENYQRGLQLLGIQTNQAQATPDILMGHIQQAQNEYLSTIRRINLEESMALIEAKTAQGEKNLSLLKEKMDYVKELKKEKQNALKDLYSRMQAEEGIAGIQAGRIYDELQGIPESQKEQFLIKVSQELGIPLNALVKAVADERQSRVTKTTGGAGGTKSGKKLTLTQIESFKKKYPDVADQIEFGMTEGEVAEIIGGSTPGSQDPFEGIKPAYSGEKLKNIGKIRKRKLMKEGVTESDIDEVERYLNMGYSLKQIAQATNMPSNIYSKFNKYIKD